MALDLIVLGVFALLVIYIGMSQQRYVVNFREFSLGFQGLSRFLLIATVVATGLSGESMVRALTQGYNHGFLGPFLTLVLPSGLSLIMAAVVVAPHAERLEGHFSIAESIGYFYGPRIRLIAAWVALIFCVGILGVQLKFAARLLQSAFDINGVHSSKIEFILVLVMAGYAALGGTSSVAAAHGLYLAVFTIILPIGMVYIFHTLVSSLYVEVGMARALTIGNNTFWKNLASGSSLVLLGFIPSLCPAKFQRLLMARTPRRIGHMFLLSAIVVIILKTLIVAIGSCLWCYDSSLKSSDLIDCILTWLSHPGFKGLTLTALLGLLLSSADAYLNSGAIILIHDITARWWYPKDVDKPIKVLEKYAPDPLLYPAQWASVVIAGAGFIVASIFHNLTIIVQFLWVLYLPVVIPLVFALIGFKTTTLTVMVTLFVGFWEAFIVFLTSIFFPWEIFYEAFFGFLIAIQVVVFLGFHYIFRQSGGWKKRKWQSSLQSNFQTLSGYIRSSPLEIGHILLFIAVLGLSQLLFFTLDPKILLWRIISMCYGILLLSMALAVSFLRWPNLRGRFQGSVLWVVFLFVNLVAIPSLFFFVSTLDLWTLVPIGLNFFMLSSLFKWPLAIILLFSGIFMGYTGAIYLGGSPVVDANMYFHETLQYLGLAMISLISLMWSKKLHADQQTRVEAQQDLLRRQLQEKDQEASGALASKKRFLANVAHNLNAPLTNITTSLHQLVNNYGSLDLNQRSELRQQLVEGYTNYRSYAQNIIDYALLSVERAKIDSQPLNLSHLVKQHIEAFRLTAPSGQSVILSLKPVRVQGNEESLKKILDNLLVNALCYGNKTPIHIRLFRNASGGGVSISDSGIGIPTRELELIFQPFEVSSLTRSIAGNRGLGLSMSRQIALAMDGALSASCSQGVTIFTLTLPLAEGVSSLKT